MGIILSMLKYFLNYLTRDDKVKICFLGPASSGKTSLMFYYNCRDKVLTIPTNGYNSDLYNFKKKEFVFWDVGAPQVRNWPAFIESADFLFFVIDSSDINSILSGKELLYQIYFGKRFRMFLEDFKEREIQRNNNYFFQEEEEDKVSYNGDDYLNLLEDPSDYESFLKRQKLDSDETETDKTSNLDNEYSSIATVDEKKGHNKIESSESIPKVNLNLLSENTKNFNDKTNDEIENDSPHEEENNKVNNKNKKRRKNKKKSQVQVHIEMSNKTDQSIVNNVNSPLKNLRKSSNESKKNANNYTAIPNEKINYTDVFNKNLKNKPLLIITNKQDLPQAYSSEEIANILGLYYFKEIKWYIRGTSCINGEGLNECLDWVIDNMTDKKIEISSPTSTKKSK